MTVTVEGLDGLLRAAGRIDRKASAQLRRELRVTVGGAFVKDAKVKVDEVGLVKTGRLKRGIRPSVQGSIVLIRDTAVNKGYSYPALHEFAHGGARAFLGPTVDMWNSSGKLETKMEGFMDWIEREWRS